MAKVALLLWVDFPSVAATDETITHEAPRLFRGNDSICRGNSSDEPELVTLSIRSVEDEGIVNHHALPSLVTAIPVWDIESELTLP